MPELATFHDLLPNMGGGKSVTYNVKYRNDYTLWNNWYTKYGQYDCPNEINGFWKWMFENIFSDTYNLAFDDCPYTSYILDFTKKTDNLTIVDITDVINSSDTVDINTIVFKNFRSLFKISYNQISELIYLPNSNIYYLEISGLDTRPGTNFSTPLNYNNGCFIDVGNVNTINIDSYFTVSNAVLKLKSVREMNITVHNNVVDTYYLPYIISFDESNDDTVIDTSTINIYYSNIRLIKKSNNGEDVVSSVEFITHYFDGFSPVMFYCDYTVTKKHVNHLIINIDMMMNNVPDDDAIKSVKISDSRGLLCLKKYAAKIDIYIDFHGYYNNIFDFSQLGNIDDIFSDFDSKSIHLKNLSSLLKSQYTADCFDIINVIE